MLENVLDGVCLPVGKGLLPWGSLFSASQTACKAKGPPFLPGPGV